MVAVEGFLDAEGGCEADYSGAFLELVLEVEFDDWGYKGGMTYPITTIVSFSGILFLGWFRLCCQFN